MKNTNPIRKFIYKASAFIEKNINIIFIIYSILIVFNIIFFLYPGSDIEFHLQRVNAVMEEFNHLGLKALPIRLYHITNNGYGYASPMFYSDIFIIPFSLIGSIFKLNTSTVYKLILIFTYLFIVLFAKYSFSLIFEKKISDLCVFLYCMSTNVFSYVLYSSLGRDFACIFIPLCFCSYYSLLYKDHKKRDSILLIAGISGLIYSNILDAVIVTVSLLIISLFDYKKFFINFKYIFISAIVCLLMCAWFIAPMLEQISSQELCVTSSKIGQEMNSLSASAIPILGYFLPSDLTYFVYYLLGFDTTTITRAYMNGALEYVFIFAILILNYKRIKEFVSESDNKRFIYGLITIFTFSLIFQTKLFPHDLLKNIFGVLQYPVRLALVLLISSILILILIINNVNKKYMKYILTITLIYTLLTFGGTYGLRFVYYTLYKGESFSNVSFDSMALGGGEYLPIEMLPGYDCHYYREFFTSRENKVLTDNKEIVLIEDKEFDKYFINYSNNNVETTVELPLVYYKGYKAVDLENNKEYEISKSDTGLVEIKIEDSSGKIVVSYEGTSIQLISDYISGISTIIVLLLIVKNRKVFLISSV